MTPETLAAHLPRQVDISRLTILLEDLRQSFPADPPTYGQLHEALHRAKSQGAIEYIRPESKRPGAGNLEAPAVSDTHPAQNTSEIPPAGTQPVASAANGLFAAIRRYLARRLFAWATALQSPAPSSCLEQAPRLPETPETPLHATPPQSPAPDHSKSCPHSKAIIEAMQALADGQQFVFLSLHAEPKWAVGISTGQLLSEVRRRAKSKSCESR